jgi:hypothetical protein
LPVPAETGSGHVGMETDQARARVEHQVQQGDVAVADDRFGVGPDRVEVDQVEVPEYCLATVVRDDRTHLGVTQQTVELLGDLVRPRRAPPAVPSSFEERRETHTEVHPFDLGHAPCEIGRVSGIERPGKRRDHDKVSRHEGPRPQQLGGLGQCSESHRESLLSTNTSERIDAKRTDSGLSSRFPARVLIICNGPLLRTPCIEGVPMLASAGIASKRFECFRGDEPTDVWAE